MARYIGVSLKIFLFLMILLPGKAQKTSVQLALSNNSTSFPVLGYPALFSESLHPGIVFRISKPIFQKTKYQLDLQGKLDAYYHQHIQTLVRFHPELAYQYHFTSQMSVYTLLGAGLGMGFEGKNAFTVNESGQYVTKNTLNFRPQWVAGIGFGFKYSVKSSANSPRLFMGFDSFLQGTFVANYVPFLPLNSVELGIQWPIKSDSK